MSFKMSHEDFKLLAKYIEKEAPGTDISFQDITNGVMEVRLSNKIEEPVVITIYEARDGAASFPKISVTRRLGDEIK